MSINRSNAIVILDSIPEQDGNTAYQLFQDLEVLTVAFEDVPPVRYELIADSAGMKDCLQALKHEAESGDFSPLIHIECHGAMEGIQLADGSTMSWRMVRDLLSPINVASQLNLMCVFATCFGGAFATSMELTERAPVWGLIGPTREVTGEEVGRDFGRFYRTLYETKSPAAAVDALNAEIGDGVYWRKTAEVFFLDVWKHYKTTLTTDDELLRRGQSMRERAIERKLQPVHTAEEYAQVLKEREPEYFEKCRDFYFMYDLFEDNQERFPVTYKDAQPTGS